jgi:hypothetical protein
MFMVVSIIIILKCLKCLECLKCPYSFIFVLIPFSDGNNAFPDYFNRLFWYPTVDGRENRVTDQE